MKRITFLILLSISMKCCTPPSPVGDIQNTDNSEASDSVLLIELSDDIKFHWNTRKHHIIEDSLFTSIISVYYESRLGICDQIIEKRITKALACPSERNLVTGDFAFLLIDKMERIPAIDVFKMQWDSYVEQCPYPNGMLDYIDSHREEVSDKLHSYLIVKMLENKISG